MPFNLQNMYNRFTIPWNGNHKIYRQLEDFAKSLGWYPSDIIEEKSTENIATGHLFVEHGLENSAVISFLNAKNDFQGLNFRQQNNLLKISYNNLVDIHIAADKFNVYGVHNRIEVDNLFYNGLINKDFVNLSSDFYSNLLSSKKLKANLISLDDALINTISYWKRYISSELNNNVSNENLSNLFNTIIFCRAIEDHYKNAEISYNEEKVLLNILITNTESVSIEKVVELFLKKYNINEWPHNILDKKLLKTFSTLNHKILYKFINDFYLNKYTPYEYDFSIISKHALSRIYERYVSILKVDEQNVQTSLFAPIPKEAMSKASGSYYTPQFIARFFSRYILQFLPNFNSQSLKIVEPSVGSGIFLRTLMEKKLESFDYLYNYNEAVIRDFENILGVDINVTACHATKLSLSLLYLVSVGTLPKTALNIINANSLEYFSGSLLNETVDIIISNPPFVAYNALSPEEREKVKQFLAEYSFGKSDLYLSFIKIALNTLKVGGIGLFVLPNTFLTSDSAKLIRKALISKCFIKCIIDLSSIQIFEEAGVYPILLIFEKTDEDVVSQKNIYNSKPLATIAKIQDKIGKALLDVLNQSEIQNPSYSIYLVNQSFFETDEWYLLAPSEYNLKIKLNSLKKLSDFAEVRTGFSTGAVEIFLTDKKDIPKKEEKIFTPYLSDREMTSYGVPSQVEKYLFYPFIQGQIISENILSESFPITYQKLLSKKSVLSKRNEVKEGKINWWEPTRPRKPGFMKIPKIVTPHLVFTPKFSVDIKGDFAISRTPFIVLDKDFGDTDLLFYFVAVLNSSVCFWWLLNHAPKYQHGYAMLERKYLDNLPIPDPNDVDRTKILQIIKLVKERIITKEDTITIENKIDRLVTDLYNLTDDERHYLNIDY